MSSVPDHLKYTKDHEWIAFDPSSGIATIGITDYAQESLGDITYVELPEVGRSLGAGETLGAVESVKAASDIYMPVAGEIAAVNGELDAGPEAINNEPYASGWMVKIRVADVQALDVLLDAAAYEALL